MKILVKSGKNVIKLIFSEQARDIIYINISKAQENPPGAYISEITFEVRATLGCLQISQIAAIVCHINVHETIIRY